MESTVTAPNQTRPASWRTPSAQVEVTVGVVGASALDRPQLTVSIARSVHSVKLLSFVSKFFPVYNRLAKSSASKAPLPHFLSGQRK